MKKTMILPVFVLAAAAAHADFAESFDTGPTGFIDTTVINFGNAAGGDDMAFSSGTWHALNNSAPVGSTGVFSNPASIPTHSGAGEVSMNFNATTGANTIDLFLMSPNLTFNNGDTISFWTRTVDSPAFPDRLFLKLSLAGTSTAAASFSTTLVAVNNGLTTSGYPNIYTQFTATISGLSGATSGRFAFNYNVPNGGPSGANSDFISIDDVNYTAAAAVPEPASMIALGLGAAALLRRRRKN